MVKLLIVDDEYIVRDGLTSTVKWAKIGVEVVGEAQSGTEGLAKVKELSPDIIISDVKMPGMDGLEFTTALRAPEYNFDGEIIMLSGYSDFNFARRSIDIGVFAYLLKPIDNDELLEKVSEAITALEKKRAEKRIVKSFFEGANILLNKIVDDIVRGKIDEAEITERLHAFNEKPIYQGVVAYAKLNDTTTPRGGEINALYCKIAALLKDDFRFLTGITANSFVLICEQIEPSKLKDVFYEALREYEKEHSATVSIGISDSFQSLQGVPAAYENAAMLQSKPLFRAINTVSMGGDFMPYKKVVSDAIKIISEDYMKNISVKTTADTLFFSESHLMHVFKDNLGKTFNECLTDFRIMKAKELLLNGHYRVGKIAELVGYPDVKYFGQVFKKHTGMTPSEFVYAESLKY
ncbi:MAG: response regulator [Christensenellaceae bacterium]|nr:response regulator [Christensenellaceae bacterium]